MLLGHWAANKQQHSPSGVPEIHKHVARTLSNQQTATFSSSGVPEIHKHVARTLSNQQTATFSSSGVSEIHKHVARTLSSQQTATVSSSAYPVRCQASQGQCKDWLAWCQYIEIGWDVVISWDSWFDLSFLSLYCITYDHLSRSVPEVLFACCWDVQQLTNNSKNISKTFVESSGHWLYN